MYKIKNRIITTLLIASLLIPMTTAASTDIVEASPLGGDGTIYAFVGTTLRSSTQEQPGGHWSNGAPGSTQNHSWNFDLFRFINDSHHAGKLPSGLSPENIEITGYGAYNFDVTDEQTTLYPTREKSRSIADYNNNYPQFKAYNIRMNEPTYDPTTGTINASASYTFDAADVFNLGSTMNRAFLREFELYERDHDTAITSMRQTLIDFYQYQSDDPSGVLGGATTDNLQIALNAYEPRALLYPDNATC